MAPECKNQVLFLIPPYKYLVRMSLGNNGTSSDTISMTTAYFFLAALPCLFDFDQGEQIVTINMNIHIQYV